MNMDLIQCDVRINTDNNLDLTMIGKAGPDAITPAEMVILMMKHSISDEFEGCCIRNACKVGEVERSKTEELQRLQLKYGAAIVEQAFPRGRHLPVAMTDVDLPAGAIDKSRPAWTAQSEQSDADLRKQYRGVLQEAGVEIPKGNLSKDDLEALMIENGLMEAA